MASDFPKVTQRVEANLELDPGLLTSRSAMPLQVLAASLLTGDNVALGGAQPP